MLLSREDWVNMLKKTVRQLKHSKPADQEYEFPDLSFLLNTED